jgi:hypothetical protein
MKKTLKHNKNKKISKKTIKRGGGPGKAAKKTAKNAKNSMRENIRSSRYYSNGTKLTTGLLRRGQRMMNKAKLYHNPKINVKTAKAKFNNMRKQHLIKKIKKEAYKEAKKEIKGILSNKNMLPGNKKTKIGEIKQKYYKITKENIEKEMKTFEQKSKLEDVEEKLARAESLPDNPRKQEYIDTLNAQKQAYEKRIKFIEATFANKELSDELKEQRYDEAKYMGYKEEIDIILSNLRQVRESSESREEFKEFKKRLSSIEKKFKKELEQKKSMSNINIENYKTEVQTELDRYSSQIRESGSEA